MNVHDAEQFCNAWLPAWTGNDPLNLIDFYHEDALYLDPASKSGIKGRDEILRYFKKLLRSNPEWKWTTEEIIPSEKGFVLKWKAVIPLRNREVVEYGLDIVEVRDGRISRNEVYFDTLKLVQSVVNRT